MFLLGARRLLTIHHRASHMQDMIERLKIRFFRHYFFHKKRSDHISPINSF